MPKSKKHLDLNISREVTTRICHQLPFLLTDFVDREGPGSSSFAARYLLETFLSKYVDESTDSADVREHRAIVKWLGVERLNGRTNERLFSTDPEFKGIGRGHVILQKVARLISKVIGNEPPEGLLSKGSFSGGATTSIKRGVGTVAKKFSGSLDVTPEAWGVLEEHIKGFSAWTTLTPGVLTPRFVRGNVLFTVPKTTVIDRVACKEPDLNIFGQKAVGDHIRERLRRKARIDLNDQTVNQKLARLGSVDGKLATIDLSSASDSLTTGLVSLVLPRAWFNLLCALRSPKTFIKGGSHVNEMFSSMGNGFTFELESLIFWAIARVVRDTTSSGGRVSVYGDDIIVPSACAGALIQFLFWVGFRTNVKKTFIRGRFRESCGGHYYGGCDVTPFYLRRPIQDVSDLILFLNQFKRWLIQTGMDSADAGWEQPNGFVLFWNSLAALVPRALRGGFDLSSRVQLVTPEPQQCELLRVGRVHHKLEMQLQTGLYLARLSRHRAPLRDPVVGLSSTEEIEYPKGQEFKTPGSNAPLSHGDYAWRYDRSSLLQWLATTETPCITPLSTLERWVVRRCKGRPWVFGLVKPLFLTEQ